MKQLKLYFIFSALLLVAFGCKQINKNPNVDEVKPYRGYFNSAVWVKVIHPEQGTGPNYLVRLYLNEDDFDAQKYFQTAKTDTSGYAVFKDVRIGECFLECRVPGNKDLNIPEYYGRTYSESIQDSAGIFTLKLVKQQ